MPSHNINIPISSNIWSMWRDAVVSTTFNTTYSTSTTRVVLPDFSNDYIDSRPDVQVSGMVQPTIIDGRGLKEDKEYIIDNRILPVGGNGGKYRKIYKTDNVLYFTNKSKTQLTVITSSRIHKFYEISECYVYSYIKSNEKRGSNIVIKFNKVTKEKI